MVFFDDDRYFSNSYHTDESKEIDYIVEDNKLKHNKFVPGVKIPIKNKSQIKNKKNTIVVLAWNFFNDIKKSNLNLSNNFINIKDLEKN